MPAEPPNSTPAAPDDDEPGHPDGYDWASDDRRDDPDGAGRPVDPWPVTSTNHATVQRARKRYGMLGAAMAGAMLAVRDILEKPKDDAAVVVEASSDPVDLDEHGITVPLDEGMAAKAPPQARPVTDAAAARQWTQRVLDRNRRRR